ncbi:MAG: Uma2 family endonuclease [Microscillaceae bacterium]|nr:Uma2 family endonuclease [Microscillaceae bacterium]
MGKTSSTFKNPTHSKRKMSLPEFLVWKPRNGSVYEWDNGQLVKKNAMKNTERYMIQNMNRAFVKTASYQAGGELLAETDCQLSPTQVRRPDLAFFTQSQIKAAAQDQQPIPAWVAEIISTFDNINEVEKKLQQYFQAGVQVVWHIFPEFKLVKVYHSFKQVKICTDSDVCTAHPAISDFEMTPDEIFNL